ncbi:hypothetical protein [Brevundimonas sp. R86498]|uniref:hypothetical protein n=1 Tax=Brevundimonas sp. R86498 TaxID=3093845 RepID=UPI0037CC11A4
MRLFLLALLLAPLALAGCAPADAPPAAPGEAAGPVAPVPPAGPAGNAEIGRVIAAILGEEAASTRMGIKFAGEGEGRIALVYLVGMNWCGTGGCNLLILRQTATGWEQVGNVSRVSTPVRVLTTATNGLPDIGVTVSGGGGPPAYEAKVSFDGRSYPRFPSDEPLIDAFGRVVITDAHIPPPAA